MKKYVKPSLKGLGPLRMVTKFTGDPPFTNLGPHGEYHIGPCASWCK